MNLWGFLATWPEYESDNPSLRKGQRFFNWQTSFVDEPATHSIVTK